MCRIFFSFRNIEIKPLLEDFLAQSIHKTKNIPHINNYIDHDQHMDGFGIAWKEHDRWEIYKQPTIFKNDPYLKTILNNIHSNIVIAHIRKKTYGNASMENTHPFHYRNSVFAQNGKIYDFIKNVEILEQYMYKPFLSKIGGKTDTEYLFFLYLSCLKYLAHNNPQHNFKNRTRKNNAKTSDFTCLQYKHIFDKTTFPNTLTHNSKYINAFILLVSIFKTYNIELVANIVYSDKNVALISRYIYYDETSYRKKQIPPLLYWNINAEQKNNNILITSEPLKGYDNILFEENSVVVLDYKKHTIHTVKIQ